MKRSNLILLILTVLGLLAFVPKVEEPIERLVSSLQKWVDKNPQEKVYLHLDKPYYALGDTLWFKAYVTIGSRHQLSKMSGALYVELTDEKDSLLNAVKLPLVAGMALGDFTLGDDYKPGNFRIRAYTQWMRNAGEEYFFDKSFVVGDPLGKSSAYGAKSKDKTKDVADGKDQSDSKGQPLTLNSSDVQFFPEGGNLVNGINSRIGFKAVSATGRGINLKGIVTDNAGLEVSNFETLHAGMGVFNFRPERGKTYKAKVVFTDGSEKIVEMPKALEEGYVLSIYQPGPDSVLVRINASPGQYQIPYAVDLMVHSSGETISATTVKINKAVNSVWLMKKDFPSGIAQFTLFDGRGEPINERIAFIRARDQMQLKLSSAKKSYKSRERVELNMEARDKSGKPVAGNFSVSVIDESQVPNYENTETTILSSMLLSSDIKGYIEEPNYYFRKDTAEVNKALDNLLLTQGYRRFVWKDILSTTVAGVATQYPAESLGTAISGRVLNLSGKPVVNGQVTLMSLAQGFMEQAKTNAEGRFSYPPIMLADSVRFALQAKTEKGGKKVELILDHLSAQTIGKNKNRPDFQTPAVGSAQINVSKTDANETPGPAGLKNQSENLKEVNIKTSKKWGFGNTINESQADQVLRPDLKMPCTTLKECMEEMQNNSSVTFSYETDTSKNASCQEQIWIPYTKSRERYVVTIDGWVIATCDYQEFLLGDASDVDKIYFSHESTAISTRLANGVPTKCVIAIYTKSGNFRKRYNPSVVNFKPKGFNKAKEFYAPRYDRPNISQQLPDLRSTIYWNPKMKTDSNGHGSFSYFNTDRPGTYKVIVEGINAAGELARQVYRYEVVGAGGPVALPESPSGKTAELVKAVQGFQQRLPAEKLYIHTDKPYYNIGDTLWFKAYLFDAATFAPSKRSGFLYIELNDDTAEAVRRINVPVKDGVAYAQIPLPRKIFHEGGYTLRAYTNWMQNFGDNYFFTQRFYLGVPTQDTWLVQSSSKISRVAEKDELQASIELIRSDRTAAGLRDVEVRLMEGSDQLYKQKLQTNLEGKLDLKYDLKEKADGRNIRLEVVSLHPNDGGQRLQIPLNIKRNQLIDLQFMPEGGNLVAGLKSVVGFKALSEDGKGTEVSGEIYDSKGKMVKAFGSLYKGMGSFEFMPVAGETYTAKLLQPEATGKPYALPAVKSDGMVLHVVNKVQEAKLSIDITASPAAIKKDSTYYLLGTSRGMVTYSKEVTADQKSFSIAKQLFPTGITRFTLLRGKTPLNERIVFIDHQENLKFSVTTNKDIYGKRENIGLSMTVTDKNGAPVKGRFSLAVTDDSQVRADSAGQHGILAGLLLSSDLKGELETPGYYLNSANKDRWQAMDNLMLTQGWTGYSWKDVFSPPKPPEYKAEQRLRVAGTVTNVINKPVAGAQMLISSQKPFFIDNTITDEKGNYVFENLPQIDSGSFFIQAKTPKGKSMNFGAVTVEKFKSAMIEENFRDQQLPWYVNSDVTQLNYIKNVIAKTKESSLKQSGIALKEVKIVDKKIIKESYNRYGPGNADLVYDAQDIKESGTMNLYQFLRQKIPGLRVVYVEQVPALMIGELLTAIIIDGGSFPLEIDTAERMTPDMLVDALSQYKVATLTGVEVLYSKKYLPRYFARNPKGPDIYIPPFRPENYLDFRVNAPNRKMREHAVIELTTTNKRGWYVNRRPDYATYRPLPLLHPQEFYSPKYTAQAKDAAEPDFRSTIFWAPDVHTDQNGKAEVSFYSSDIPGSYSVNVQGADRDGNIGGTHLKINTNGKQLAEDQATVIPKITPTELSKGKTTEIVKAVQGLQQRKPAEKLYLHLDKPYYNLGDTIWFKAYLLNAATLSASKRSGVLFVELDDDTADAVRRISIPIKNGIGYAQIPLTSKIFHEGGFTLRAYTNWMQNFGSDYFFTRRLYLGIPSPNTWLVQSSSKIVRNGEKDQLEVNMVLSRPDQSAAGLRDVMVRMMDGDDQLYKEKLQTTTAGELTIRHELKEKADGRNIRIEIRTLHPSDGDQRMRVPINIRRMQNIDLQFLPEGGHLVAGLKSVVGFKALTEDGKGTEVTGTVYDVKGNLVSSFASLQKGMGSFDFIPKAGESYTAKLTTPEKTTKVYHLPAVQDTGTVLHIINQQHGDSLAVDIWSSAGAMNPDSSYYLLATTAGIPTYAGQIEGGDNHYLLPKQSFPEGITRFSLLRNKTVLNERIVFIDHQEGLQVFLNPDKQRYHQRDSVSVTLLVKDKNGLPVKGNFSVSVTDDGQVKADAAGHQHIRTAMLLTSDLKGTVENPADYLNKNREESWRALDNLMLTQGWVGYDWKDVFANPKPLAFEAQQYLKITGLVTNILNKPIPGAQMLISSQKPAFISTTITDEKGRYTFQNFPQIDSGSFFIQAKTTKGKTMNFGAVTVEHTRFPVVPETNRDQLLPWYVNTDGTQLNYVKTRYLLQNERDPKLSGIALKEVNIRKLKIIKGSYFPYPGKADIIQDEQDIKESAVMDLYQLLRQKIGARVVIAPEDGKAKLKIGRNNAIVIADSYKWPLPIRVDDPFSVDELIEELSSYKVAGFRGIEMGASGLLGIKKPLSDEEIAIEKKSGIVTLAIFLTTKSGKGWYKMNTPDRVTFRPLPVMRPLVFYSPKYLSTEEGAASDYRSTILWKPDVMTNEQGEAKITFYTSDVISGSYTINLQGADMDGRIGSAITTIKIEKPKP